MQRTTTHHPFPTPRTASDEIPGFIIRCPACAHLLVNCLIEMNQDARDATQAYMDANGCRYPDSTLEALEARAERIGKLRDDARLYQRIAREHQWAHVHASYDCSETQPTESDSLCPTNMPDPGDTPLLQREHYAPKNFHTRRVRLMLLTLRVSA